MIKANGFDAARARLILLSTLLWGFAAHGFMFFNKFSFHDDVRLPFHIGATVTSGRWFLQALKFVCETFFGGLFSLPLFNGLLSLLLVAASAVLAAELLRVRRRASCVCLAGVMAAFPAFTSTLGYMYTAPFYMAGLLMASCGALLVCRGGGRALPLLGCVLIACSIGVYQASLPTVMSLMLIYAVRELLERGDGFDYWREGFRLAFAVALSLALYLAANHLCLHFAGAQLSEYESINTYGFGGWGEYVGRVCTAYREFFVSPRGKIRNMYPQLPMQILNLAIISFGAALAVVRAAHMPRGCACKLLLLVLLFPLAADFVYVMVDTALTHSLMMYSRVSAFLMFIVLLEASTSDLRPHRALYKVGIGAVALMAVFFVRFANICYFKAEFQQSQAISYFTRLVSRIESADGYSPDLPVAFLNDKRKLGFSAPQIREFDEIRLLPYYFTDTNQMINNYAWKDFMRMWCGFAPIVIENTERFAEMPDVMMMPRYPTDGSIKVVDGTVVVKF